MVKGRQAGTWDPLLQCLKLDKVSSSHKIQKSNKGLKIPGACFLEELLPKSTCHTAQQICPHLHGSIPSPGQYVTCCPVCDLGEKRMKKSEKDAQREVIKTDVLGETDLESQNERLQKIGQKYHG